jgi:hypothetical protein
MGFMKTGGSVDKRKFEIPADIKYTENKVSSSDPAFDCLGKNFDKGFKDLQYMFGPKKKK